MAVAECMELVQVFPLLRAALGEIERWRESSPEAGEYSEEFYEALRRLLLRALESDTRDCLLRRLAVTRHVIADRGPQSEDFLPSLQRAWRLLF